MKIAAGLGLVFAIFAAIISMLAFNDLANTGEEISGGIGPLFSLMPSLVTILILGFFGFGTLISAFMMFFRPR